MTNLCTFNMVCFDVDSFFKTRARNIRAKGSVKKGRL